MDAAKLAQARRLRAIAWSLVRQQGYMLAQIEGELRVNAPDRAVEGLVGEFGDDGSGVWRLFVLWMMIYLTATDY